MRALVTLVWLATSAGVAWAHGYQELGTLEKQAVDEALALRGLTLEPQPDGKTIGAVHVVNLDVFSPRDLFFQFFNRFHWTTRDEMIRREALFRPGQTYQQALIDETTRNLDSPVYTSALGIVAVKSATPGQVDVLIVTRDLWSLRLNTNFELQQGRLTMLSASLAENNLFGWRKSLALVADLNQGRLSIGPTYVDSNIAGTRLTATASMRAIFGRESHAAEGSAASLAVGYPLYALDRKWGGAISSSYSDGTVRVFRGTKLRTVPLECPADAPPTCADVEREWTYHLGSFLVSSSATRRFYRAGVVHEVSGGHGLSLTRPTLLPGFPADPPEHPTATQQFISQVFPRAGYISQLFLRYQLFTPRYRVYRDFNSFDLRESARLGPNVAVTVDQAARFLGSDREYVTLSAAGSWSFDLFDGFQSFQLGWSARHQGGTWTDQLLSASGAVATPVIARALRVVAAGSTGILLDDTNNAYVALGGDSGLRGYTIGDLLGKSSIVAHLEVRSMALSVLSLRAGGLLFYDVGDAATPEVAAGSVLSRAVATLRAFTPRHDVGFGLRILIPQFNTYVLRVDWAFALQTTANTRAGWPGRFSAGFSQVF